MEILAELFLTAFVAFLFSFLIAKLVSVATAGDAVSGSETKSGFDKAEGVVMQELRFGEKLEVLGSDSEKRVQLVRETADKIDELEAEPSMSDHVAKSGREIEEEIYQVAERSAFEVKFDDSVEEEKTENREEGREEIGEVKEIDEESKSQEGDAVQTEDIGIEERQSKGLQVGGEEKEVKLESEGDEDDDWEGIERTELEKTFAAAVKFVEEKGEMENVGSDVQKELYGLHKVATEGPCREPQPLALKVSARAKWNAWQRLGNMSPEVAMEKYTAILSDRVPRWMDDNSAGEHKLEAAEAMLPSVKAVEVKSSDNQSDFTQERNMELESAEKGSDLSGASSVENQAKAEHSSSDLSP